MKMSKVGFAAVLVASLAFTADAAGLAPGESRVPPSDAFRLWGHQAAAAKLTPVEGGARVVYTADDDWALNVFKSIPVAPGDVFTFSATARIDEGQGALGASKMCVTLLDSGNSVVNWGWASRNLVAGSQVESRFVVPAGVAAMQPRFVGGGKTDVVISGVKLTARERLASGGKVQPLRCANAALALELDADGAVSVTDRRTGRVWRSQKGMAMPIAAKALERGFEAEFVDVETTTRFRATWRLDADRPEFTVEIAGDGELSAALAYPAPFATRKGDRLFYPQNEGVSFPVEEKHPIAQQLAMFNGSGLCMAFFGVMEDATGAGWMTIVETADDAGMRTARDADGCVSAGPEWCGQLDRFAYTRRARYVFYPCGGHVAACKRYRAYARQIGRWKPFTEKLKIRPRLDRLFGAVNVWCWEGGKEKWIKRLQDAGIRRILWSGGGSAAEVKALAANPDVLVGRYDIYTDVYHPEQLKKLGWKSGCNAEAWPNDVVWSGPSSNDWTRAWGVKAKDGTWTHCATLCDLVSPAYCRRNIANDLKTKPFNARFLDVTTAGKWKECHNPRHPMSRSVSREARTKLLAVVSEEFKLVTGGETGHDFSVPTCDYYEGMLSLCPYRVPDSGRNIRQIWTNAPANVVTYQVGEKYRLPLWELVFHDCTCSQWYWGDYNNKLPQLWDKRDLFNVLYGTMGMFVVNATHWAEHRDDFVKSYAITSPVARSTALHEMTDHLVLTSDRAVQRTTFANGVVVTVNFGPRPWTDPADGTFIGPRSYSVRGL